MLPGALARKWSPVPLMETRTWPSSGSRSPRIKWSEDWQPTATTHQRAVTSTKTSAQRLAARTLFWKDVTQTVLKLSVVSDPRFVCCPQLLQVMASSSRLEQKLDCWLWSQKVFIVLVMCLTALWVFTLYVYDISGSSSWTTAKNWSIGAQSIDFKMSGCVWWMLTHWHISVQCGLQGLMRLNTHTHTEEILKSVFNVHNEFSVNSLNNLVCAHVTCYVISYMDIVSMISPTGFWRVMDMKQNWCWCFSVKPASETPSVSNFCE